MSMGEDQKALIDWIHQRKIRAYEFGRNIANLPEDKLKHYGYKTHGDALINLFKVAEKEIEERIRSFERKYPNDGDVEDEESNRRTR